MPPATTADNGGFAFMVTVRPREYDEQVEAAMLEYIDGKVDHFLAVREKGNHSHWALFFHKGVQRSNLITMLLRGPLKSYFDEDEAKLFRRYDRERKTGAVINMTTLGIVAQYLSGEFDKKEFDEFLVIDEKLPSSEDISELEEYLPAVDGLKRKRQVSVWYAQQAEKYKLKDMPMPATERTVLQFLNTRMYVDKDIDILADQRILKQKTVALVRYINEDGSATYNDGHLLDEDNCLAGRKSQKVHVQARAYRAFIPDLEGDGRFIY